MFPVFYRSVSDGWRVGFTDSIDGVKVQVHDGAVRETISASDIYIAEPHGESEGGDEQKLLFHMADHPQVFLQESDAALMSPSPLVGLPPLIELLRYRTTSGEPSTNVGDNFSIILGKDNFSDVHPPGYDTALKAVLVWKGTGKRQIIVSCGHAQPNLCNTLVISCCSFLNATPDELKVIKAGMDVISAFTSTLGRRQMCYLQTHVSAEKGPSGKFNGVHVECSHLSTAGIGDANDFNFKIFSYILYGFSTEERERFLFNRKQQDFMCQSNIEDVNLVSRIREEHCKFIEAAETLGLSPSMRLSFFARMAAIVHLTEIEFYTDGSISNLSALQNAAHLLQLDVRVCLTIFTSREVCVAAARLLYNATFAQVLKEVNDAMRFSMGESLLPSTSISVLTIPPLPSPASDDLENIVIAGVYENLTQAFLRSSDQEVLYWQRAGFCPPEKLQQAVLDSLDNYSLLKVMYGLGGLLSVAQVAHTSKEMEPALKRCAKHSQVRFNTSTLVLTVVHSFGERHYQFPRCERDLKRLKTVHHADYKEIRSFLMEETDVETRKALSLVSEMGDESLSQIVAQEARDVKPLLDILHDEANMFWWIGSVDLGADYNGDYVEMQLREMPLLSAVQLRRYLPNHYVKCHHEFIISNFKFLLPSDVVVTYSTSDSALTMDLAERLLEQNSVKYYETQGGFLLTTAALVELHLKMQEKTCQHVTLIQAFVRTHFCAHAIWRRIVAQTEVIQQIEQQWKQAVDRYRHHPETCGIPCSVLLDLMEEENTARSNIREECWRERAELQQEAQEKVENFLVQLVALSIREREESMRSAMRCKHAGKLHMIDDYARECLEKHRARLDGIVEEQLHRSQSQFNMQRALKAQENLFRQREISQSRLTQLETALDRKRSKSVVSQRECERKAVEKGMMLKIRQQRNETARKQITQAREDFTETLGVQLMLLDMESKMARRVKNEILSFQRQKNERLEQKFREERQRWEEAEIQTEKKKARRRAQEEMRVEKSKEAEKRRKRHEAQVQLDLQERQRRAMERIETAKEIQRKKVMDKVLRAQSSFSKPWLYEHRSSRTFVRKSTFDRHLSEPLYMTGGGATYTRMLSESSLHGLLNYHKTKPRRKSPYPYASSMR